MIPNYFEVIEGNLAQSKRHFYKHFLFVNQMDVKKTHNSLSLSMGWFLNSDNTGIWNFYHD